MVCQFPKCNTESSIFFHPKNTQSLPDRKLFKHLVDVAKQTQFGSVWETQLIQVWEQIGLLTPKFHLLTRDKLHLLGKSPVFI